MRQAITIKTYDHKGRVYKEFHATRYHWPGWFVFGRNYDAYASIVTLVAWPDRPQKFNHTFRGWRTKREARRVADRLNQMLNDGSLPARMEGSMQIDLAA